MVEEHGQNPSVVILEDPGFPQESPAECLCGQSNWYVIHAVLVVSSIRHPGWRRRKGHLLVGELDAEGQSPHWAVLHLRNLEKLWREESSEKCDIQELSCLHTLSVRLASAAPHTNSTGAR